MNDTSPWKRIGIVTTALSGLLIATHFFRAGNYLLLFVGLLFPAFLFIGHRWATILVQGCLVLASIEWLRTMVIIAQERLASGESWIRMAVILVGVAVFTFTSAILIHQPKRCKINLKRPSNDL